MILDEVFAFGRELPRAYARNEARRADVLATQQRRLRDILRRASLTPRLAAQRFDRLTDVEPLTKRMILEHFDDTTVGGPSRADVFAFLQSQRPGDTLDGRYVVATTSGTTGEVGVFVHDLVDFARTRATVFARIFRGQLTTEGFSLLARRRYRMTFVVAVQGHTMSAVLALRMPRVGRVVAAVDVRSIDEPLPRLLDALNRTRPMLLHSYPTLLEVLAAEQAKGSLRIEPEIITAGSEPVTSSCRAAIAKAFPGAQLVETWAATEHLALATSCRHGSLHLNEDVVVLEPIDDQGRATPVGELSDRVLLTNLLNRTQPLVRYELADRVRILEEAAGCACGSPFVRVEVHGRTDDTFYLIDELGRLQSHPPIPLEIALLGAPGLAQFQLVHETQNVLQLSFVSDAHDAAAVAGELDARLARYLAAHSLLGSIRISIEQVDALVRHARSRKLRQIRSQVSRPPGPVVPAAAVRNARE